jgi:hypothetical protein
VKATSVSVRLRIFLFAFKIPNRDQTDLTKGRDASGEAMEEASGRGGPKP